MRDLGLVENDRVFEFGRIAHHDAVTNHNIFAYVTAAANLAVLADPRRPFQHRALFDDRSAPNENVTTNKRFADQLAEHSRLQSKLQVARDLFERVPDVF